MLVACFGMNLGWHSVGVGEEIPLLDFVEAGEKRDGDKDDDCFFAVADFELWVGEREALLVCALPFVHNFRAILGGEGLSSGGRARAMMTHGIL